MWSNLRTECIFCNLECTGTKTQVVGHLIRDPHKCVPRCPKPSSSTTAWARTERTAKNRRDTMLATLSSLASEGVASQDDSSDPKELHEAENFLSSDIATRNSNGMDSSSNSVCMLDANSSNPVTFNKHMRTSEV